ncbi:uncharacterized protein LOC108742568 [Agrilus planipennis]|uniref:Uncharacterized protein LOC108742568 n=1 Tax=Agrilus planipennis TaxID=224129 RepID=A0A1W4XLT1_AGRPL|nr:uncharacterized protein LOC108742568 [Agrilus planipennis]
MMMIYRTMNYHNLLTISTILLQTMDFIDSFWPLAYDVDLYENETFEIAEDIASDMKSLTGDEDEMIRQIEIKLLGFTQNSNQYYFLHRLIKRNNKKLKKFKYKMDNTTENQQIIVKTEEVTEPNYILDDSQPWIGGFVDKEGHLKSNKVIISQQNDTERIISKRDDLLKLEDTKTFEEQPFYDYQVLKNEYKDEMEKEKKTNQTFNYTEIKEDETMKEAAKSMIEFKKPKNCTNEEQMGIGYGTLVCFLQDLKGPESRKTVTLLTYRITQILIVLLILYMVIAFPCWCQRGWCCCCFRCKFCKPVLRIHKARQFLAKNPLGIYHTKDNKKIVYKPTYQEEYVYKQLHKALMKI